MAWSWNESVAGRLSNWFNKKMYGVRPSGDPEQYPEGKFTDYGPMQQALMAEIARSGEKQRGDIVQGMANRGIWQSNVPEMGPLGEQRKGEQEMSTKIIAEMMMRGQQEKNQDWLRRQGWAREDVQMWEANRAATRAALWNAMGKTVGAGASFFA